MNNTRSCLYPFKSILGQLFLLFALLLTQQAFADQVVVSNLKVASGKAYKWGTLEEGALVYIDRTMVYKTVPAAFQGLQYLKTANDDKANTSNPFISFSIDRPVEVFVAFDARNTTLPTWLKDWNDTGQTVVTSDTTRRIYQKAFSAGTVSLGGNATSRNSMYTVFLRASSTGSTNPTSEESSVESSVEPTPLTITNTQVGSGKSYVWDVLSSGTSVYMDRTYTYTNVPSALEGMHSLQTANNDKGYSAYPFITFDINGPSTVYVAYDVRNATVPGWLSSWTNTGQKITTSDSLTTLHLYSKTFSAGTVSLGGNETGMFSMYTVLVAPGQSSGSDSGSDSGTDSGSDTGSDTGSDSGSDPSPVNTAPTISGSPATEVVVGSLYSFTPTANDADGDQLTFSITNKPAWASFNASTGKLSGTPTAMDQGTTYNVVISVSDGTASASLAAFNLSVVQMAMGTASLSWTPPTTNTDGSALTDLAGYKIYYGNTAGNYSNVITISNSGVTSYVVENLPSGTHYFVMTAYTNSGLESAYSNMGSKTIP